MITIVIGTEFRSFLSRGTCIDVPSVEQSHPLFRSVSGFRIKGGCHTHPVGLGLAGVIEA